MTRTRQFVLAIAVSGILGSVASLAVAGGYQGEGTPIAPVMRWAHRGARVENKVRALEKRSAELEELKTELRALQGRVEGSDGVLAFEEAKALGIVDFVAQARPKMRPASIRRVSIALVTEARRHDLDPQLLAAVARVESNFDPYATSHVGARGLLQLMPPTGRELSEDKGEVLANDAELYDIETNIALGAMYLADLVKRFSSVDAALVAYNRGPANARAALKGENARDVLAGYPKKVLSEKERLAQLVAKRQAGLL